MTPEMSDHVERWYGELYRLMWAMVWDVADIDRFYLEPDDVFAELSEELVKIVLHYWGKPDEEMKNILITSLRNRCKDLQVMEYHTHRDAEGVLDSLDADLPNYEGVTLADRLDRPSVEDMYFDLEGFVETLGDDEYLLVMEVLNPSDRCMEELELSAMRKITISDMGLWKLSPTMNMYRKALGWTYDRVQEAWNAVREHISVWIAV